MSNRLSELLTTSPARLKARNRAIRESSSVGVVFEGTFEHWRLPDAQSYARADRKLPFTQQAMMRELRKLNEQPAKYSAECKSEFERIVAGAAGRVKRPSDEKKLHFHRIWGKSPPDLLVKVRLRGTGVEGGPYHNRQGRTGMAMTGARVTGTVSLCVEGHPEYSKRFSGTKSPPSTIPEYEAWGDPPFRKAIAASNVDKLIKKMLSRFFVAAS